MKETIMKHFTWFKREHIVSKCMLEWIYKGMRTAKLVNTYRATVRDINTLLDTVCVSVARNDLHYCGRQICMMPLASLAFGIQYVSRAIPALSPGPGIRTGSMMAVLFSPLIRLHIWQRVLVSLMICYTDSTLPGRACVLDTDVNPTLDETFSSVLRSSRSICLSLHINRKEWVSFKGGTLWYFAIQHTGDEFNYCFFTDDPVSLQNYKIA